MEFLVILERGNSSYGAYVPDLPGCVAVGDSRRRAMKLIRKAIPMHIRAMRDSGEPVPAPTTRGEIVKIKAT